MYDEDLYYIQHLLTYCNVIMMFSIAIIIFNIILELTS